MIDQAGKLRTMVDGSSAPELQAKQPKIYSILSGKGGVGKTSIAVNLGIALHKLGKRVLILDADIGMGNVNILLGEVVRYDILDALKTGISLRDIIVSSRYGIDIMMGGADLFGLEELDAEQQAGIHKSLGVLEEYDIIIIDNGAGISRQSLAFTILGDELILVTTPEPTAITDAYKVLKIVSLYKLKSSVKVVINQAHNQENADETFEKLYHTSKEFLKLKLERAGSIFSDSRVNRAVMDQVPFVVKYPTSLACKGVDAMARGMLNGESGIERVDALSRLGNRILRIFG
ncbi:MinD/ParA family protein [Gudongella oleilytica]|jgi:flagellar biosynthesis protein FlhG|uniref:MinD/ParA family protein n=1 Tax=Gudongella oleilytica TaxID=1582259 RepID=UPI002A35D4D4|nr:MinD/ParA family protein [Gudongella oleilytica]MDY0256574.1 MinD/ParA family protein [Gudongella oleilytica]HMM68991.1 MinD/ParA family protein [Gudongella oleilytica]